MLRGLLRSAVVDGRPLAAVERTEHWERAYGLDGARSWFQATPQPSLAMVEEAGLEPGAAVLDIGAGRSDLACELARRGLVVTALDLSAVALERARERCVDGSRVSWVVGDILAFERPDRFRLVHDRAVFHFFTDPEEQEAYATRLRELLEPGGEIVLLTFAADGPSTCSGLPVSRYDTAALVAALGQGFRLVDARRSLHETPSGATQPFTCVRCRFDPDGSGQDA